METTLKQGVVVCDSGMLGWKHSLQENYGSFEDFENWDEIYNLHSRLGYVSALEAWEDNPMIQGSSIPSDFRRSNGLPNAEVEEAYQAVVSATVEVKVALEAEGFDLTYSAAKTALEVAEEEYLSRLRYGLD